MCERRKGHGILPSGNKSPRASESPQARGAQREPVIEGKMRTTIEVDAVSVVNAQDPNDASRCLSQATVLRYHPSTESSCMYRPPLVTVYANKNSRPASISQKYIQSHQYHSRASNGKMETRKEEKALPGFEPGLTENPTKSQNPL
jgi:hypothetical protein